MQDQLPFAFATRPSFARNDFIQGAANGEALAWIERWPDWPGTALALSGPEASGKSHLAAIWVERAGATIIPADALTGSALPKLLGEAKSVLIDPADAAPEQPLLHLFNLLTERGGHLLIVSREPPARWPIKLADLRSRLAASTHVAVAMPDTELLGAILVKLFADRQLAAPREVIDYLALHLERSFAAARDAVARLDRAALAERRRITVPLARQVLGFGEESLPLIP